MSKRAKAARPENAGKDGADGISRRAFLKTSAVGAGAAAAAAGMAKVANASIEGPRPPRLDDLKSDNPHGGQLVAHALRHNLPVVAVIVNDGAWGMIKAAQIGMYGKDRLVASELGHVRYDKWVEGFGGHGEMVERPGDIRPALQRALASGKPACVNVICQTVPR